MPGNIMNSAVFYIQSINVLLVNTPDIAPQKNKGGDLLKIN